MSREERLNTLKDSVIEFADNRVELWREQAALLRRIMEGRTSDGEVSNHLAALSIPYLDQSVNDLLEGE